MRIARQLGLSRAALYYYVRDREDLVVQCYRRACAVMAAEQLAAYLRQRFPDLAGRPLVESRVCQYENSSNGDLLIDRHPAWPNVLLVGAGSGHGFKHGPAIGRYAAQLLTAPRFEPEPRFSLASKGLSQHREVH